MLIWRSLTPRSLASVFDGLANGGPRLHTRRLFRAARLQVTPPAPPTAAPLRGSRGSPLVRHNR